MTPDPREEPIKRAYDEARFDERTPDEAGFAERFEGFKPRLKENVPLNLLIAKAQARRKLAALFIAGFIVVSFAPLIVLLNAGREGVAEKAFNGMAVAVIFFVILVALLRKVEEDPNRKLLIGAVLERFGCKVVPLDAALMRMNYGSPIAPANGWMDVSRHVVVGEIDGRAFVALRVITWRKQGKGRAMSFRGWHLIVDLPFAFSGTTVVSPRGASRGLRQGLVLGAASLEDPEFSGRLNVETDDQVEARVILSPDVIRHLSDSAVRLDRGLGGLTLGFSGSQAHIWIPSDESALSDWRPLNPPKLIEDLHEAFAEMAEIRAFLRDIDVIAESEGFRAQAARNAR